MRSKALELLDYLDFEGEDYEQNPNLNHIWNSIQIVRYMWNTDQIEFVRGHLKQVLDYLIAYEGNTESEILGKALELREEYFGEN